MSYRFYYAATSGAFLKIFLKNLEVAYSQLQARFVLKTVFEPS